MGTDWCDAYLRLTRNGQPVKGEASDEDYPNAIELLSFEVGSLHAFSETQHYYAGQQESNRREIGFERMRAHVEDLKRQSGGKGGVKFMAAALEHADDYEGIDLSEEEACQFQITKLLDWSSPDLFQAYCSVQNPEKKMIFESAVVSQRKTGGEKSKAYLEFHFSDVAVASYSLEVGGDSLPKETIGFSFGRCRMEYKPQDATGGLDTAIKAGWSFVDRSEW